MARKIDTEHLNTFTAYLAEKIYDIFVRKQFGKGLSENDYTDEGQLLGHIIIGVELLGKRISAMPGFPVKLANELKHCILSHHGELEYGSPKKPAIAEAVALSFADNTDAKMQTMKEALAAGDGTSGWLGYNRLFESNIRRTSEE